ncbi:DUF6114 domain-containing protein [Microbacterium sp. STN6]|uniref:DUF6114 domain-containing protein n=1 Tax=Microbacterium sp. STN6 TaxID=2995588 RepID=UPI003A599347
MLAGIEIFFSGQLDIGKIHVHVGIEGLQATIIPVLLVLLGILVIAMPAHRIFYGVIALVVSVYSLVGVNLGGFFIGMLLGAVGGVITVAWMPKRGNMVASGDGVAGDGVAGDGVAGDRAAEGGEGAERAERAERGDGGDDDHERDANAGHESRRLARMRPRTPWRGAHGRAAVALVLAASLTGVGAAAAPDQARAGLCIPILMHCSSPAPSPTPSDSPTGGGASTGGSATNDPGPGDGGGSAGGATGGGASSDGTTPATPAPQGSAIRDAGAPIFTLPAARLGGKSISFTGIPTVQLVTVQLIDGRTVPVLKLSADSIQIDGFSLDVGKQTGPVLVTHADRMQLRGHVQVYVDSLSATLGDGTTIALGTDTTSPTPQLPSSLLTVNLGLVGVTADSITFTPTHQVLKG